MARDLILTTDIIAGEGHPLFPDTKNKYLREIWADFLKEHTDAGEHASPYNAFALLDHGDYTGTGAILTVSFALTFTAVVCLLLWGEDDGDLYFCTTAGQTKKASDGSKVTTGVLTIDTDGFTLGTYAGLNTDTSTYFWCAIGMGPSPDIGSNLSPPAWIADSTPCLGGNAATMANAVEDDLDTKFLTKHTMTTGAHDDSEFDGLAKAHTGTFSVSGHHAQAVMLANANLQITALWLWDAVGFLAFQTASMLNLREYTTAALPFSNYVSLGTGQFTIDGTKLDAANRVILGIDGEWTGSITQVTDTSENAYPIYNPAEGGTAAISRSIAQAKTGTYSLALPVAGYTASRCLVYPNKPVVANFALSFAIYIPTAADTFAGTILLWTNAATTAYIKIEIENAGGTHTLKMSLKDDSGNTDTLTSSSDLSDSAWHVIEVARVSGALTLTVDAGSEDTGMLLGQFLTLNYLYLGVWEITPDAGIECYLDDVQISVQQPYFPMNAVLRYVAIGED